MRTCSAQSEHVSMVDSAICTVRLHLKRRFHDTQIIINKQLQHIFYNYIAIGCQLQCELFATTAATVRNCCDLLQAAVYWRWGFYSDARKRSVPEIGDEQMYVKFNVIRTEDS